MAGLKKYFKKKGRWTEWTVVILMGEVVALGMEDGRRREGRDCSILF